MARTLASRPGTVYDASEGDKFNTDTELTVVDCPTCGITYAIPESLERAARTHKGDRPNGWKLCCPLGHTWWYVGKTEVERQTEIVAYHRDRAGRLAHERDQAKAEARGQKAAKTRIRNERDRERRRVVAGVCPAGCNRTFKDLARHMAAKHPEHGQEASE
jgi:hypothetical protein